MTCELGIPVNPTALYPVYTDVGAMATELTERTPTDIKPDHEAACAIKIAIIAHLKAKKLQPDLPDNFQLQLLCKRCGDQVTFSAE